MNTNNARLSVAASMLALALAAPAHAGRTPNPIATDNRIRQVQYDPNQVYEVVGSYGFQTTLEFGRNEGVVNWVVGDSIAWQVRHAAATPNKLFIKPVEPNATTNLTVTTSCCTYYMSLGSAKDRSRPTYVVRFIGAGSGDMAGPRAAAPAPAARQAANSGTLVDPSRQNIDYEWAGDKKAIRLQRVFDDGQFTWFKFEQGAQIPVIQVVESDGTPSTVNARRQGDFLVVERTAAMFTLLSGPDGKTTLCVKNNAAKG